MENEVRESVETMENIRLEPVGGNEINEVLEQVEENAKEPSAPVSIEPETGTNRCRIVGTLVSDIEQHHAVGDRVFVHCIIAARNSLGQNSRMNVIIAQDNIHGTFEIGDRVMVIGRMCSREEYGRSGIRSYYTSGFQMYPNRGSDVNEVELEGIVSGKSPLSKVKDNVVCNLEVCIPRGRDIYDHIPVSAWSPEADKESIAYVLQNMRPGSPIHLIGEQVARGQKKNSKERLTANGIRIKSII